MSYAVVRMVKLKSHDLKGIQFHNQRERDSKTNLDIDKSKSELNYDLLNSTKIDYNKRVKEIIETQKEGTRKIRKDAVLVNEFLVTSDKKFFDELSPKREKEFFQESVEFFKERYGEQNIVFATVHVDEKTPHLHIGVVPMRDGKLQGKNIFNRQELLALQDVFPKQMKVKGFDLERGELGSKAEHIEIQKFKAITIDQKVKELECSLKEVQQVYEVVQKVDSIEVKDKRDLKTKMGLKGSHRVEIAFEDFEQVKLLAKTSETLKTRNKRLTSEVERLEKENVALKNRSFKIAEENGKLMTENKQLTQLVKSYEASVDYLQKTIEVIKSNSKKHLEIGLERMQSYIGESRLHVLFNKIGIQVFQKESLEKLVPKDEHEGAEKYMAKINKMNLENEKQKEIEKITPSRKSKDMELER